MKNELEEIYKVEQWKITEEHYDIKNNYRNETTFSLSNGYIGTRGTMEEGYDFSVEEGLEGNFINGFYESEKIRYGEWNFGFPTESQSLLNLPNLKIIQVVLNGETMDIRCGKTQNYKRVLELKQGKVVRSFDYTFKNGSKIQVLMERLVSFEHKNTMAQNIEIIPLNFEDKIEIVSILDADVENHTRKTNPLVDYGPFGKHINSDAIDYENNISYYEGTTSNSKLTVACGSLDEIKGHIVDSSVSIAGDKITARYFVLAKKGEQISFHKYIAYSSSLDMDKNKLKTFIKEELIKSKGIGFQTLNEEQINYMERFWENTDIEIDGDDRLQQGLRFNLFHIMQSAGRSKGCGMGAKGLSGEGYEGHYFWDTEMYVLPVFVYTMPELAKSLLNYRFDTLDSARKRAKVLGHQKGALYPWRTINGEEASTYFPLGTAQYHINADIAYSFWLYINVTNDLEYLKEKGIDVLVETARVLADVGCFSESRGGKYCICSVTGPDEYNAIVDNNFYTNLMARENLRYALKALELMEESDKQAYDTIVRRLDISEEEKQDWKEIIDNMYFPYDEINKIYPLDDGFMMRKPWDDSKIPEEKRHLLYENYHPLFVYRQRMSKQADAILGLYLLSDQFTKEELKRNYDFYQKVTLHHSSLSTCIFGMLACRIGYYEEAFSYFADSARMDLDDMHHNFYAGIHAANMAGTYLSIVNGFAGMRVSSGKLEFFPYIPKGWNSYSFSMSYQNSKIKVKILRGQIEIMLLNSVPIEFEINQKGFRLDNMGEKVNEKI